MFRDRRTDSEDMGVVSRVLNCLVCGVVILGLGTPGVYAQPPREASDSVPGITGRVVADETGDPLANARVSVRGTPPTPDAVVLTNADGRFTLAAAAGAQTLTASKPGYSRRQVTAIPGSPVELRLLRGAAISGRVVNEYGNPVTDARVVAETVAVPPAPVETVASTQTDDRGEYRLGSLVPAVVTVSAFSRGALVNQNIGGGVTITMPSTARNVLSGSADHGCGASATVIGRAGAIFNRSGRARRPGRRCTWEVRSTGTAASSR